MNVQIGAYCFELRLPAQTAGAYPRPVRQILNARVLLGNEHIVRVLPFGDGRNLKPGRHLGGQIF